MPRAAAVATAQRVGGGGGGMGDLLAAVHPLGPGGLLLLRRAGGAFRAFACSGLAGTGSAGIRAVPASTEGTGHLLPGSGHTRCSAAACGLCAGLGDVAQARRRALAPPPAAAEPAWNADLALLAADVAARAAAGELGGGRGHACARHDRTAHASRGGTDSNTGADRADGRARHRARAELRCTGHEAGGDPGPKMPSASSASEASITTSAWSMEGSSG